MKTKHTTGPWKQIDAGDEIEIYHGERYKADNCVATVRRELRGMATRANADLIAAAPEMLDALKNWELDYSLKESLGGLDIADKIWLEKLQKIIAKAEGRA